MERLLDVLVSTQRQLQVALQRIITSVPRDLADAAAWLKKRNRTRHQRRVQESDSSMRAEDRENAAFDGQRVRELSG